MGPWDRIFTHGACNGSDIDRDVFFPGRNEPHKTARAKAICARCDVRTDCLLYAVAHDIKDGIWGGLTRGERRAIRFDRLRDAS